MERGKKRKKMSPVALAAPSLTATTNCGIGLPPAFTANCLHSNEKRPRLSRILDDLPRAKQRRDNGRRWLKVGPRRRPQMGFSLPLPSFWILHFPSAAARALRLHRPRRTEANQRSTPRCRIHFPLTVGVAEKSDTSRAHLSPCGSLERRERCN